MRASGQVQSTGQDLPSVSEASVVRDYKQIADRSTSMIAIWQYETNRYVYVNEAILYVTGYEPAELLQGGREFALAKIHPDDIKQGARLYDASLNKAKYRSPDIDDTKPFFTLEFRLKHKDGHWVWLHQEGCVYSRDAEGRIEYIIGTTVNIDKQKAFEEKLLGAAKSLEASHARLRKDHEQLLAMNAAKDEFVSIATHQLRAPATAVKQYLGILLQRYVGDLSDAQRKTLQSAYDSNDRQLRTIDDLLSKVRIDAGNVHLYKTQFNLIRLIEDIAKEQKVKYTERKQTLIVHGDTRRNFMVYADEHLIRMVIENLVDNASKYSMSGKQVEVRLRSEANKVAVDVQDQGIGISKNDQTKLFKKFSRIDSSRTSNIQGTGLGLYWAKEVITLHGGTLRLKASDKSGSTFTFTLPT
jgi:PAS domain S-box-containing protein